MQHAKGRRKWLNKFWCENLNWRAHFGDPQVTGRRILNSVINTAVLTLLWPAGYICPTYKGSFQVRWDNSIPLFLHAAIYLEVSLFRWTSQNAFSLVHMIQCAILYSSIAHSIICTRLFRGKMNSDWFNGIEILQGRWQHGEKMGYCYPSGLEKTLCKWDIYVPLVTKELNCGLNSVCYYTYSGELLWSRKWTLDSKEFWTFLDNFSD